MNDPEQPGSSLPPGFQFPEDWGKGGITLPFDALHDEIARLKAALEFERQELVRRSEHSTHWDGCEKDHPMCAAIKRISKALSPPRTA